MKKDFLSFLVFFVVSVVLIQLVLLVVLFDSSVESNLFKGDATRSGSFQFCLNFPPVLNVSHCPSVFNQSTTLEDNTVFCYVNASHPRGHEVVIDNYSSVYNGLFFNLFEDGSFSLSANQSGVGNRSVPVSGFDIGECSFWAVEYYDFEVLDINDPPYLKNNLPNIVLKDGSTIVAFALGDYFGDVDIRPEWGKSSLNYSYAAVGNLRVQVIISPNSFVTVISPEGNCETDYVIFEAKDGGNLTADSNVVSIESRCDGVDSDPGRDLSGFDSPCISDWRCDPWSDCFINGTQYRFCRDRMGCEKDKTFWRDCEYVATCFDGVQNCHVMLDGSILCEDGVDCGGPCEPCRRIETPGLIIDESADNLILFTALIVVFIASLLAAYIVFRKQIMSFFAKIGWWLTRKKRKQFLLNDSDKADLLRIVNELYIRVFNSSNADFDRTSKDLIAVLSVSRKYLSLALKISLEFDLEESKKGLRRRVFNASLRQGMLLYVESLFPKERKSVLLSKQALLTFIQETRMLIMNTSKLSKDDFTFRALELELPKPVFDNAQALVHNSFLALCFSESVSVKSNYFELLRLYDEMSDVEKNNIYYELSKVYLYTKAVLSWI